jgi:hypothetical protein
MVTKCNGHPVPTNFTPFHTAMAEQLSVVTGQAKLNGWLVGAKIPSSIFRYFSA